MQCKRRPYRQTRRERNNRLLHKKVLSAHNKRNPRKAEILMLLRGKTLILRQHLRRRKTNPDNNYRVFTYAHLPQLLPFARGFYRNTILPAHNGRGRPNEISFCRPRFLCFSLGTLFVIPTCYSAENQSFALTDALCGLQILFCPPALRKPTPQAAISSSQIRRKAKSRRDKNSPIFVRCS